MGIRIEGDTLIIDLRHKEIVGHTTKKGFKKQIEVLRGIKNEKC